MARQLKIATRVPENEIPRGRPTDWLSQDIGEYIVSMVSLFCLHVYMYQSSLWARQPVVTGHLAIILM